MPSHSATRVKNGAACYPCLIEIRKILLKIDFARMPPIVEGRPFVTKTILRSLRCLIESSEDKSWNAGIDRISCVTASTCQRMRRQSEPVVTLWTSEEVEGQASFWGLQP